MQQQVTPTLALTLTPALTLRPAPALTLDLTLPLDLTLTLTLTPAPAPAPALTLSLTLTITLTLTLTRDQITLSHYIKSLDVAPDLDTAERATVIQAAYRGRQSRRGSTDLKDSREKSALAIQRRQRRKSNPDMSMMMAGGGGSEGFALSDANDEVWAERIKGIKAAYVDSCTRLGSALEELEQTLCLLTGTA